MRDLFSNIKYLDLFPEDAGFIHDGEQNNRSYLNVQHSIILISASSLVALMFSQEIYIKKRPSVSMSKEYIKNIEVDIRKWPLLIVLTDGLGKELDNQYNQYNKIKLGKINITSDRTVEYIGYPPVLEFTICSMEDFNYSLAYLIRSEVDDFYKRSLYSFRADTDGLFTNPYKAQNSGFIIIKVDLCDSNESAYSENIDNITKEYYVEIYFIYSYIDSLDF
jgi:hypothetical protein